MQILDYIRITGVLEICPISLDVFDVTFNIVHSQDSDFRNPKRGVFTLRLSEFVSIRNISDQDAKDIAHRLVGQILIRGKGEDGSVEVLHLLGMALGDWLIKNTKFS